MYIVKGIQTSVGSLEGMESGIQEMEQSIQRLRRLPNIGTTTHELAVLDEAFQRVKHFRKTLHENLADVKDRLEQLDAHRVQEERQAEQRQMDDLRDVITQQLSNHDFAYSYATATWSADALWKISFNKRESIKETLRDFFAERGLAFGGWNPSDRINPLLDPLPADYASHIAEVANTAEV